MLMRSVMLLAFMFIGLSSKADVMGVYGGVGYWKSDFGGDVISDVDVDDDLNISSDNGAHIFVGFEHPVPLLPNIKIARTNIKDSGTGTLDSTFVFQGQTFTVNQSVDTSVDLSHTDFTFYYELVDIGMDVDVGVTGRWFDGEVRVDQASEDLDVVLPMLYARGKFYLPFSGLYVGGDAHGVSYSGNRVTDLAVKVGWQTESFIFPEFGIEGGYRKLTLEGDEDDTDVDVNVDIDGVFINLTAHF